MPNTYTWSINRMDCYPTQGENTDVVFAVYWTLSGTDGATECSTYGSTQIALNPSDTFVPFAQLTQEQVIGWVKEALGDDGVAGREDAIAYQITQAAAPTTMTPALPWS